MSQAIWRAIDELRARFDKLVPTSAARGNRLYAARYQTAVALQFANSVTTVVNYATPTYDVGSRVTVGAAWHYTSGRDDLYRVAAAVLFDSSTQWAAGEAALLAIYKNGVLYSVPRRFDSISSATGQFMQLAIVDTVPLAVSDTLDIRLTQTSGAGAGFLPLTPNAAYNFVTIDPVG